MAKVLFETTRNNGKQDTKKDCSQDPICSPLHPPPRPSCWCRDSPPLPSCWWDEPEALGNVNCRQEYSDVKMFWTEMWNIKCLLCKFYQMFMCEGHILRNYIKASIGNGHQTHLKLFLHDFHLCLRVLSTHGRRRNRFRPWQYEIAHQHTCIRYWCCFHCFHCHCHPLIGCH